MFKVWCLRFDGWEICPWTYEGYDDQESKDTGRELYLEETAWTAPGFNIVQTRPISMGCPSYCNVLLS